MLRNWKRLYNRTLSPDKEYARVIRSITGYTPVNVELYRLAFRHSSLVTNSKRSAQECNERLEYLGDSVLGAVVSDFLFQKYPTRDEGYLTEMRSRIVNRKSLNTLGAKLGLDELLEYNRRQNGFHQSMVGNSLEAFIGAIYSDCGYHAARRFIITRVLKPHVDLEELAENNLNFKSQLMEFVQKHKLKGLTYEVVAPRESNNNRLFTIAVKIGGEVMGTGQDTKKKMAEQKASAEALVKLNVLKPTVVAAIQ
jgi:ribonuclease-3